MEQETRRARAYIEQPQQSSSYYSDGMPGSAAQGPSMGAPNGAINPRNGQFYPSVGGGGVLNPRSGEVYPAAGPGLVVNPRTGQGMPVN